MLQTRIDSPASGALHYTYILFLLFVCIFFSLKKSSHSWGNNWLKCPFCTDSEQPRLQVYVLTAVLCKSWSSIPKPGSEAGGKLGVQVLGWNECLPLPSITSVMLGYLGYPMVQLYRCCFSLRTPLAWSLRHIPSYLQLSARLYHQFLPGSIVWKLTGTVRYT